MTETTTEIPHLEPTKRAEALAWKDYSDRFGLELTPDVILKNVLRGVAPPETDTTVSSEERRRDAALGLSTTELSPVERDIWRINRDAVLKATDENPYAKPPGEHVDIGRWKDEQWAEYGWTVAEKRSAEALLIDVFNMDALSAKRAAEALLLAGYTANEVQERIESKRSEINTTDKRYGYMSIFQNVFSDAEHLIYDSSLKIVFDQEAFESQKQSYGDPQTMEDLAWRLAWTGAKGGPSGDWMPGKEYAMFEARGDTVDDVDAGGNRIKRFKKGGKYYVNEDSFLHWFRDEMVVLYDIWGPNTPIQVMEQVQSRMSNMNLIRLREMVEKQESFKSEDAKTEYMQLWLKLQLEAWTFQLLYDNDITYRQSVVSLEKWLEQYENMTFMNPLTIFGFRTNLIQQLLIGTNTYREGRADVDGGKFLSDNKLGGAFAELVLAFYNLGDFDELERVLGSDSSFFTREGWIKAIEGIADAQKMRPGGGIKLAPDERKAFDKAFDERTGKVKNKKEFIKFINTLGYSNLPGSHLQLIVTKAISDSVQKRFELGEDSGLDLVVAEAWFFNRFMGGLARNDIKMTGYKDKKKKDYYTPNPSVHDKPSELFNMGANREKYASKGGGKPYGNLQTIAQFKASAIDPMVGLVTMEEVPVYDAYGNLVKGQTMKKSLLTVLTESHELQVQQQARIQSMKQQLKERHLDEDSPAYKAAMDQIEAEEKRLSRIYMHYVADNASFHDNAHREYTQVHLKAAKNFTERVMKGEGLDFNQFTGYDPWGGVTVKREVLSQQLQKNMLGLARDMVKKYNWMNFNEDVRVPYYDRKTGDYGFRDGKLGERMFGYDLLNRKEFWMQDEKGRYIKEHGMHVIDFNKVEKDRVTLMKQMFMTEIAADMYNHQVLNSGDQRFHHAYYLNMLDVLRTMPAKLIVDEFAKHGITVPESFFSKEDLEWFKARALNGNVLGINMGTFGFYLKYVLSSMFDRTDKEGLGFGKTLGIIAKAIFSS